MPNNYLLSINQPIFRVYLLGLSSKNEATYWCSGFASNKFEKILGDGHAQQETYVVKSLVDPLRGFSQIFRTKLL